MLLIEFERVTAGRAGARTGDDDIGGGGAIEADEVAANFEARLAHHARLHARLSRWSPGRSIRTAPTRDTSARATSRVARDDARSRADSARQLSHVRAALLARRPRTGLQVPALVVPLRALTCPRTDLPKAEGLLPKWILLVAFTAVFNSVQNFLTLNLTRRLYSRATSGMPSRLFPRSRV